MRFAQKVCQVGAHERKTKHSHINSLALKGNISHVADFSCHMSSLCRHWAGDHVWWTLIWDCRRCCCRRSRWRFRVGHFIDSAPMLRHLSSLPTSVSACPSLGDPSKKLWTTHIAFASETLYSSECHVPTREGEWRRCEKSAHVAQKENGAI